MRGNIRDCIKNNNKYRNKNRIRNIITVRIMSKLKLRENNKKYYK